MRNDSTLHQFIALGSFCSWKAKTLQCSMHDRICLFRTRRLAKVLKLQKHVILSAHYILTYFAQNDADINFLSLKMTASWRTVTYTVGPWYHGKSWNFVSFFDKLFSCIKDLKAKYPTKDWAQVRGRLLGICNLTAEDVSLNKAVKKVCFAFIKIPEYS